MCQYSFLCSGKAAGFSMLGQRAFHSGSNTLSACAKIATDFIPKSCQSKRSCMIQSFATDTFRPLEPHLYMSRVMRKPAFCICKNKSADQYSNCTADQRLCFRFIDVVQALYFLNPKYQASNRLSWLYIPICVGPGWKAQR